MSFIELKDVKKTFQTKQGEVQALNGIELSIEKGEVFGIVGFSGAGKSTLVRLLNGLETVTSGEVIIDGKNIVTMKKRELRSFRKKVGMVFQHFDLLWSRTVQENIELPMEIAGIEKSERNKRSKELIELVGLSGKENSYPSELSGGQKQRVGIARAISNEPDILLSDESTSALDPQTTDEVLELLHTINQKLGLTIVLITHEMHVIRKIADRVVVMEQGKIIESGTVHDVFQNPQTQTTKNFVMQELDPEVIENKELLKNIQNDFPTGTIANLVYDEGAKDSVIAKTIRKFDIEISILSGNLSQTTSGVMGSLTVLIKGEEELKNQAIEYIQASGVKLEVLQYD